jgi:hypothetical protein
MSDTNEMQLAIWLARMCAAKMRPPPGLKWIDTVAMRRQIDAEKPQG